MLRPLEWLDTHKVVVGGSVAMDLPELGAQGNARVLAVSPCPEIKPGPGQVITATFAHPATNQILDVTIGEGDDAETIGVTDNHPFWSETHQAFVPVGQLSVGDELLTLQGQKKRLTAILPRHCPRERVYNLEVHGGHTYYVGHQQLLVHNSYPEDYLAVPVGNARGVYTFRSSGTGTHLVRTTRVGGQKVRLNSGHGYNRAHKSGDLRGSGLSIDDIDNAIVDDIIQFRKGNGLIPNVTGTGARHIDRAINVNGMNVGYRLNQLADGTLNVSTYWPN